MNKLIVTTILVLSTTSYSAQTKYQDIDGRPLTAVEAIVGLARGARVFKTVELELSEKGTIKNKKVTK